MRPHCPNVLLPTFAAFGLLICSPTWAQDAAPTPDATAPAPDAVPAHAEAGPAPPTPPTASVPTPPVMVTPAPALPPAAPVYDKRVVPPWANSVEPVDPSNHADYDPSMGDLPDRGGKLFDGASSFGPSNGITNTLGNGFLLQWDGARRLRGAVESQDRKPLLTLAYDANGNLADVKNSLGDTIHYRFGATPGQPGASLLAVSTPLTAASPNGLSRYVFTYAVGGNRTLLKSISVPDPGGPGRSISTIPYLDGKVAAHVDAEGNRHVMTYGDGHTLVQIAGPDGKVVASWVQKYDAQGRDTGGTR